MRRTKQQDDRGETLSFGLYANLLSRSDFMHDNWKKGTFYPTQTKGLRFKASEPIIDKMHHEPTLVLDRGRWFICYAIDVPKPEPLNSELAIALDPGIRTFRAWV